MTARQAHRQPARPERGPEEEKRYGKVYDRRVMRRLWPFMTPYQVTLGLAGLCMLGGSLSQLLAPYLVKLSLDGVIARGDLHGLYLMVLFYAGNALGGWLLQYSETLLITRTAQRILLDLLHALFAKLMRLDSGFYDRQAVGRLMSRVQNDVGTLQDLFASGILNTLGDLLMLGGILGILWSMHGTLTLVTCTVVPFVVLLTACWRVQSRRAFQQVRTTLARVNAHLQENIAGVRVIQSLVSEAHNLRRFAAVNATHLDANLRAARLSALFFPTVEMFSATAIALVIVFGGPLVLAGSLSAGGLVAFVLYIQRFFEPIRDLSFRWNSLQMAMASGERILEVLDAEVHIQDPPHPVVLARLRGEVHFRQVSFAYQPDTPVLREVSFQVPAGQHVALVGHTGAGKTTLVNLIARFYDVTAGSVCLDGVDVRHCALASLRRQIGVVLQEPFLFSGTVRDNLRYGRPQASEVEIQAAAQAIGVHERILQLVHGYDTHVHERGGVLSQGQRQLISFVRALLADPRILILDEATASVDTETERLIQAGLTTLLRGRTAFIIAHRLSTVRDADRILVLEHGRIVADGTHHTLLRQGGLYERLYRKSYAGLQDEVSLQSGA